MRGFFRNLKNRRAARKARQAERLASAGTLLPPEGVPINLPIAGVGVRLGAQITDILITTIAVGSFIIFMSASGLAAPRTIFTIFVLLFFMIRIPYYVLSELVWNGQTLGKRWLKIKVVAHDGGSLSTHALVVRNLMKEAEIFLPGTLLFTLDASAPIASWIAVLWVAMAFAIPLLNPYRRRLGDFIAGTHVVHMPEPILLKDLATSSASSKDPARTDFTFLAHQLDHYGAYELQTLETVLRAGERNMPYALAKRREVTLMSIVDKIRTKIGYPDPVAIKEADKFLRAFYNAQRAHLEQRQLFGDRRADKHHRAKNKVPEA